MDEPVWTEKAWDESDDIVRMWETIRPALSDRRTWLLACALCRKIPGFLDSVSDHRNLIAAEGFIEGEDTLQMMLDSFGGTEWDIRFHRLHASEAMNGCLESIWSEHEGDEEAWSPYAEILKEIVGNPFRTKHPTAFRCTPEIGSFAARIYRTKRFDLISELVDLLVEAECDDTNLLEHLSQPQEHIRGCWALDQLMGYHTGLAISNQNPDAELLSWEAEAGDESAVAPLTDADTTSVTQEGAAGGVAGGEPVTINLEPTRMADWLGVDETAMRLIDLKVGIMGAIRANREANGLTQAALAKRLGIARSRIAEMEAFRPEVSLDALIPALLAAGGTTEELCRIVRHTDKSMNY